MDDSSRGIATAALTLHSNLLQTLVRKAVPTPTEALEVVDRSLTPSGGHRTSRLRRRSPRPARARGCKGSIFYRDAISTMAAPNSRACSLGISILTVTTRPGSARTRRLSITASSPACAFAL